MSNIKPKLISFELCPYVQRSIILLKKKGVDYNIERKYLTYIKNTGSALARQILED